MSLPLITCPICNKRVDRVEEDFNIFTFKKVYRMFCHGMIYEVEPPSPEQVQSEFEGLIQDIQTYGLGPME